MRVLWLVYIVLSRLPPFQRAACFTLLLQSAGSLLVIFVFCTVQAAGVDIHFFEMPWVAHFFTDVYQIDPRATFAKTRFDDLFIPLVIFYGITLPSLLASIVRNLPAILKDFRRNIRILRGAAFFLFCLWLELFIRGPTIHKDLQQNVIDGGVIGYIILFVIIPLALAIVAAGLPLPKKRDGSHDRLISTRAPS